MDPRKRDQQREHERKASLRKASDIIYTPLDGTSDTPDLAAGREGGVGFESIPVDDVSHHSTPSRDPTSSPPAIDTSFDRSNEASQDHFTFQKSNSRSRKSLSRDPSPLSPVGESSSRFRAESNTDDDGFRPRQSTGGRSTNVKLRGSIEEEEEDSDEDEKQQLPQHSGMAGSARRNRRKREKSLQEKLEERLTAIKNFILRRTATVSTGDGREVNVDVMRTSPRIDVRTNGPYIHNAIRSSKYTYWSFLPRQIMFQFSKFANVYFLCISILQMIPGLSTTGTYTTIIPLLIFVTISMAKEGWEDLRRHELDKSENRANITRAKGNSWETVQWQALQVGDVIRLERDESTPADIVLLHVDGAEDRCYVETMALDGETNLKSKGAPTSLLKMKLTAEQTLARNDISMHVEDPNLDLYNFSGNIDVQGEKLPLNNDNVIYRGSIIRNTKQALGLVVYTGEECKIRMNANKRPRIKSPRMQAVVNKVVLFIVAIVILLAVILSVLYLVQEPAERQAFYIKNATVSIVPVFVSFIIMLNTMIPLSLYVSMEIVKVWQIYWMMGDLDMYDPLTDTPMDAKTSTINEELGQVSYVFSDKTGTLTDNIMKFRKLSVAGTAWLHDPEAPEEDFTDYPVKGKGYNRVERPSLEGTPMMGKSEDLIRMIRDNPHTEFAQVARHFVLSIALCHTCVSERKEDGFDYSATSPDEVALAQAAQEMGFVFLDRRAGVVTIRMPSDDGPLVEEQYQVLEILEFSSKRKRMSMVVRMPDGKICVFTKGADSIIKELLRQTDLTKESSAKVQRKATVRKSIEAADYMRRKSVQQARFSFARTSKHLARQSIVHDADNLPPLSPMSPMKMDFGKRSNAMDFAQGRQSWHAANPSIELVTSPTFMAPQGHFGQATDVGGIDPQAPPQSEEADQFEKCFQHIDYFATDGLRTLLYAYRYVEQDEYSKWSKIYHDASTSLTDREQKIEQAAALIEQGLELAGATAIEDKLQDGVPLTIDRLRRAGIKVWVLTGDKRETAINIGRSCQLIKDFSKVAILDHLNGDIFLQIQSALTEMREAVHSVVVVDGQTLAMIEEDDALFDFFHALATFVDSVLCCRSSPAQKALLVKSIRTRVPNSVTLAIGDGSNDVAMIQEAHVGIGIAGREGLEAARTSDYSIARFRFLTKLLLVHGRWNYLRICKYTLATFWKEMLFFLTQAMFQKYNGYTGTSLYESWSLSQFNTLFTSLPVIFLGVFEKDLKAETLIAVPELYNYGQRCRGFNLKVYAAWAAMAAGNAALVYYLPMTLFGQAVPVDDMQLFTFGSLCFTAAVIVINLKIQFWEIHYKTMFAAIALVAEIGGWFLWNIILSAVYPNNTIYKVKGNFLHGFGRSSMWWTTLVLTVAMSFAFEMLVKMTRQVLLTNDVDVHQKLEKDPAIWRYIESAAHAGELSEDPRQAERQPLQRTKTQQFRRDQEYDLLLSRTRSGTVNSDGSVENIKRMPRKLVRFLTREESSTAASLRAPTPTTSGTDSATNRNVTPAGSPGPSWNRPGSIRQDYELTNMPLTPGDSGEQADYFGSPQPNQSLINKGKGRSTSVS